MEDKEIKCPHCGAELTGWDVFEFQQSEGQEGCPECGAEVSHDEWISL
jgi:DNA-directed RNA polymerase subunit RPC12/RpoP